MRGPSPYFIYIVLILQLVITGLCHCLLLRVFSAYRRRLPQAAYWTFSLAAATVFWVSRLLRPHAEWLGGTFYPIVGAAYAWTIGQIVLLLLLTVCLAAAWLWRLASRRRGAAPNGPDGISRREFITTAVAIAPAAALGFSAGGLLAAYGEPEINRYTLELPDFPPALKGIKIAQLSDVHLGAFCGLSRLDAVLAAVVQEKPEAVVITGDFIDDLALLDPAVERLSRLAASIPYGVYFCWGNHEYFRDINKIYAALKASPVVILANASHILAGGDRPLCLLGVDYPWARDRREQEENRRLYLSRAQRNLPANAYPILISHHPDFILDAFAAGIPLTLAGHTHGGQVAVAGKPLLPLTYRFMRGLYRQGRLVAYVHAGTGHWLPFRLGCPAEIAVFTLR
ncbi:MAG: metallophosphoesterase [Negativicutes bacterium]|nr:metallophosphoesterase [Negativicutes bacterium]